MVRLRHRARTIALFCRGRFSRSDFDRCCRRGVSFRRTAALWLCRLDSRCRFPFADGGLGVRRFWRGLCRGCLRARPASGRRLHLRSFAGSRFGRWGRLACRRRNGLGDSAGLALPGYGIGLRLSCRGRGIHSSLAHRRGHFRDHFRRRHFGCRGFAARLG